MGETESQYLSDFKAKYEARFGSETVREERLEFLKTELIAVLEQAGINVVDNLEEVEVGRVLLAGRVKNLDRALFKTNRMPLEVMPDIWGFTIVTKDNEMDKIAKLITETFLGEVPEEERTWQATNGSSWVVPVKKDYRDRNMERIAVHNDYEAIHMVRKAEFGPVEVRVIAKEIWKRTKDPNDILFHANLEKRQTAAVDFYKQRYTG